MIRTSLKYFMAVARLGSIRAASSQLHVAQSAVSRQIQSLEYQLRSVLLERQTNGVALTEAGRILYEFGRKAEFDTSQMQSELDSLQGMLRGHVRVAAIEAMIPNVLPHSIGQFRARYPGITFAIEAAPSAHITSLVNDGGADIGIGLNARPGPDFNVVSSMPQKLVAVTNAAHPLALLESVTLHDLARWPMALAPQPSASRVIFDEACRAADLKITPAVETNSVELVQRLATLGHTVALMLRHTIAASLRDGQLRELELDKQLFVGTVDVFTFKHRTLPIAVQEFLHVLQAEIWPDPPA